ncbi:uncharacterized protein LOC126890548 [Diabrotica virgifera virgifera]|uniref:THAP-type domain-containing protein n=1 Tax=Diabrotica virgifera virgifera TaxID=50390 RepID=A0ABM5KZA0_DIAVI|nr:uncharacterized protein LOC126890548 [Diabrotica virgifera virgifera]
MEQHTKRLRKCSVPGCNDATSNRLRFPNPNNDKDMFLEWLKIIKRNRLSKYTPLRVYKNFRICSRHFKEEDRVPDVKSGRRGIIKGAIPRLFLPPQSKKCTSDYQDEENYLGYVRPSTSQQDRNMEQDRNARPSTSQQDLSSNMEQDRNARPSTSQQDIMERDIEETPAKKRFIDHDYAKSPTSQQDLSDNMDQDRNARPSTSQQDLSNNMEQDRNARPSTSQQDIMETDIEETPAKKRFIDHDYAKSPTYQQDLSDNMEQDRNARPSTSQQDLSDNMEQDRNAGGKQQGRKARRGILKSIQISRKQYLTPKKRKMYTKIVASSNRIHKLAYRLSSYQEKLQAAKRLSETVPFRKLAEQVNPLTYTFILSQIRTQQQKLKGRKFTIDEKVLALTLFKGSGKGYKLLSKIFSLPSKRTLTNLLNKIKLNPGINEIMFEMLQKSVHKMTPRDRHCVLMFDEMFLSTRLQYNQKEDKIEGLEDYGTERCPNFANYINVFMIKGIYKQWKQPICYTFSDGATKSRKLKNLIIDVIKQLQNIGLTVVATVCDQGGPNAAAVNLLIQESRTEYLRIGQDYQYFGFLVNGKEIVPLYDTPHLFKGLRNNLLNKDLHFELHGKKGIAKWDHIEQFYQLDASEPLRICPKLTDEHVLRNKIKKMKVKNCMQVFSHQVGSLMVKLVEWKAEVNLCSEVADTGRIILFLDELFDSLNSNQKTAPVSKPLKGGVTLTSNHDQFWKRSLTVLNKMKFFDRKKQKFVSVPSLKNLNFTIRGFLYLKNKLLKTNNNYLLLRAFQQDALENFFGLIRSYRATDNSVSVSDAITTFKALVINNFMSFHSPESNCEKDVSEGALDTLRFFLTGEVLPGCTPLVPDLNYSLPMSVSNVKKTRVGRCTVTYVAGYVAKKVLKKVSCEQCKYNMLFRDKKGDTEFIEARQYNMSNLTVPGNLLTHYVSEALAKLFYLIPRVCHMQPLHSILCEQLNKDKLLTFSVFNCKIHSNVGSNLCKFIVRLSVYMWCKSVNTILNGKDQKFINGIKSKSEYTKTDPIKLVAYRKYEKRRKQFFKDRS